MSFLYDLYNESMNDFLFKKTAQNIPPISPNEVAKKLVSRLEREISGIPESLNISSENSSSVDLGVNQLQNLGKLLQFMSANKIKVDNIRVVFPEAEASSLPEEERHKLSPVSVNMSRDAVSRKWNTADFYTNLPLLIKYVTYLQNKAQELKRNGDVQGRILEVMIGKLIDSVNNIKPDSGLSRSPKSKPDLPNEMPQETVVDNFGTKIFDINNPYTDKGPLVLTGKDLFSKESLNAWMKQAPEAQILDGQSSIKFTDPSANHCNIINVLHKRASNLVRISSSPEDTKKYNFYLNKITQLGPAFTDPQGKACSIGGSTSPSAGLYNKHNFLGQPGGDGTGGTGISTQILEQLVQSLPLDPQDIDFNRIRNFFNLYTRVTSSDNAQSAITSMGTALYAMTTVSGLTLTGNQQNFRITRNVQELITWLKSPAGNNALQFLYALQQIITETGKVLRMFYNEFVRTTYSGDRQTLNSEQKALVESQILGANSIYSQNLRDIQSLIANFKNTVSTQK